MPLKTIYFHGMPIIDWIVTNDNQVGPDTGTDDKDRTGGVPRTDLNTKWFGKIGGAGGPGTRAAPYLTAQQAIDATVAAGGAFIYWGCIDSENYVENIDCKGLLEGYADAGENPTIKYNDVGFSVLHDFGQECNSFIEWGDYILAATNSGIWRSNDGGHTFALWVLTGKNITGMALWNDGISTDLYVANSTDRYVTKVTSAGATSTFKDFTTELNGLQSMTVVNGVLIALGGGNSGYYDLYYYKSASWLAPINASTTTGGTALNAPQSQNTTLSTRYGFLRGFTKINTADETGVFLLDSDGTDITISALYENAEGLVQRDIFISDDKVYYLKQTRLYVNNGFNSNPYNFILLARSDNIPSWTGIALHVFEDLKRNLYITQNNTTMLFSVNNGATWTTKSLPANTIVSNFIEYAEGLILGDSNASGNTTVYQDLTIIRSTAGAGTINGFKIDGDNLAWFNANGYDGNIIFKWSELYNAVQTHRDLKNQAMTLLNCFWHDEDFGPEKELNTLTIAECAWYNITNGGWKGTNCTVNIDHFTSFNSGYGFTNGGSLTITAIKNGIIQSSTFADINSVDDMQNESGFDYVRFKTTAGGKTITPFSNHFQDNVLFISEIETINLKLKSLAAGHAFDSQFIKGGLGQSSDSKDLGAYLITRTINTTTYGVNYRCDFNPNRGNYSKSVANFGSGVNPLGEFNSWFSNNRNLKRTIPFEWDVEESGPDYYRNLEQAAQLEYIYSLKGVILEMGLSTDGVNWSPVLIGSGATVNDTAKTITFTNCVLLRKRVGVQEYFDLPYFGPDKFQGWWLKVDGEHYRINEHDAKPEGGSVVFNLDDPNGTLSSGSGKDFQLDYLKVQVNQTNPFKPQALVGFRPDLDAYLSGYNLTVEEVGISGA